MSSTTTVSSTPSSNSSVPQKGLKWIESTDKLPSQSPNQLRAPESKPFTSREKMAMVMKNPLVPFGMAATVAALVLGIKANLKGDRFRQQMMMRYRVGFQGFTVLMLVGGLAAAQMLIRDDD